jgi:SAM-dependent methyltransferase
MHPSVMAFVAEQVAENGWSDLEVLEVGSFDVNGTVRDLFTGSYHGVDMREGPGVDEVLLASEVGEKYPCRFEVVVSTEVCEHDPLPWVSLASMLKACRPGGHLILTARGYDERGCFPLHDHPQDLWRFSCDGMRALLNHTGWTEDRVEPDPEAPGVFAVAHRPL